MSSDKTKAAAAACPPEAQETAKLELQSMRNWYLLASFTALSTIGLLIAVTPILSKSISAFWPWARTDLVLMVGLGGSILLLILHLTYQQIKVTGLRHHMQAIETKATETRQQNSSRLHALLNVSRMMGSVTDPSSVFEAITSTCMEIFDCHQSSLMLLNSETNMLEMKAATGHVNQERVKQVKQPVGKGIAGYVALQKMPVILGKNVDPGKYPGLKVQAMKLTAAMVVPILVRDELVGVLNISSRAEDTLYYEEDLRALEVFAENAGTCIRQAERSEWMRQTIERMRRQNAHDNPAPALDSVPLVVDP
ncbi:MAG: GAF domain-containing protein [Candidatus Krumholzibacteriota bacterium]